MFKVMQKVINKVGNKVVISDEILIKESLTGWIGDGKTEVELTSVYLRQLDKADKYGVFGLSYARMCEVLEKLGYKLYQYASDCDCNIAYVKLPKLIKQ